MLKITRSHFDSDPIQTPLTTDHPRAAPIADRPTERAKSDMKDCILSQM